MKNYAYLDKAGIMHMVDTKELAEKSKGRGVVVETEVPCALGYPVIGKEGIIVYSETEMKFDAKKPTIKDAELKYPQLSALYKQCRG